MAASKAPSRNGPRYMSDLDPFPKGLPAGPPSLGPRLEGLLKRIAFPGLAFEVTTDSTFTEGFRWYLRVVAPEGSPYAIDSHDKAPDGGSLPPLPWAGRKWRLSPHMTDGEIAQTALKAILTALEHEARERFLVDGVPVFDPHYDLDKLVALRSSQGGGLKERT